MKKRLTRFLPFLLAFTIALPSYSVFAEEENQAKETQTNETNETQADETTANDTLSLAAETAVLIDAASGEILYDKDADKKMYPASITKLMTILLALENGKLTVGAAAVQNTGFAVGSSSLSPAVRILPSSKAKH